MTKLVRDSLDLMHRTAALNGLDLVQVSDGRWLLITEGDYPLPLKAMTTEEMSVFLFRELVMLYEKEIYGDEPAVTSPPSLKALMSDPAGMFAGDKGGVS